MQVRKKMGLFLGRNQTSLLGKTQAAENQKPESAKNNNKSVTVKNARQNKSIGDFLKTINKIRLILNGARGLGHQTTCITVMQRLWELGFNGVFDIVYSEDQIKEDFSFLLSASCFQDKNKLDQMVTLHKLSEPIGEYQNLSFAPLIITGADDHSFMHEDLTVKYNGSMYINLQPTGENGFRWIESISDDQKTALNDDAILYCNNSFTNSDITPHDFINELIKKKQNNFVHFQSVYGLYPSKTYDTNDHSGVPTGFTEPSEELKVILLAIQKAQLVYKKPTIILVHSVIDQSYYDDLFSFMKSQTTGNGAVYIANDMKQGLELINTLGWYDILVCKIGKIPRSLFEFLLIENTLPPIAEGGNTISFLEANKPFLHGGLPSGKIRIIPEAYLKKHETDTNLQKIHMEACSVLEKGDWKNYEILSHFLLAVLDRKMDKYFNTRKEFILDQDDIVGSAVLHASDLTVCNQEDIIKIYFKRINQILSEGKRNTSRIEFYIRRLHEFFQNNALNIENFYNVCIQAVNKLISLADNENNNYYRDKLITAAKEINELLPVTTQRKIFYYSNNNIHTNQSLSFFGGDDSNKDESFIISLDQSYTEINITPEWFK